MDSEATLRRRDWHATRQLILDTFARMVVEDGLRDVSIQQVADRAGVSHRTVYRHFASRQELINQLAEWLHERGLERGEVTIPIDAAEIPAAIEQNARVFDQDADLIKALVLATWESGMVADIQQQRTGAIEQSLAPLTADLAPEHARAVTALIRYLASSRTWLAFRDEFDLTGEESGPVVAWAIQLILDALNNPTTPDPGAVVREETHDDD